MIPDITINGTSMLSLGWLRESVSFPTPQSQSEVVTVPGRNTPIRYTEALGSVSFKPRTFSITLTMLGTRSEFSRQSAVIINRYAGRLCRVSLNEEPDLYAVGTLEAEPAYDPISGKGQVVFSCQAGDSYRYHTEETIIVQSGKAVLTLQNDFMPVVPVITTTADTDLSWKVGTDTFRKTVSAGTWEIPELELKEGTNTISVNTTGSVTFRYREGCL